MPGGVNVPEWSIDMESAHQTPLVPADAGTQALPQKLGSRIRGNERVDASTRNSRALVLQPGGEGYAHAASNELARPAARVAAFAAGFDLAKAPPLAIERVRTPQCSIGSASSRHSTRSGRLFGAADAFTLRQG